VPEYDNNMRGVMFKNDRKENDKHPDYKGSAEINGVQYWVSGWIKTPNSGGNKFLSMSFKAKDEQPTQQPAPATPAAAPRSAPRPQTQGAFGNKPHEPVGDSQIPFAADAFSV
jgi:hypothetical protein